MGVPRRNNCILPHRHSDGKFAKSPETVFCGLLMNCHFKQSLNDFVSCFQGKENEYTSFYINSASCANADSNVTHTHTHTHTHICARHACTHTRLHTIKNTHTCANRTHTHIITYNTHTHTHTLNFQLHVHLITCTLHRKISTYLKSKFEVEEKKFQSH